MTGTATAVSLDGPWAWGGITVTCSREASPELVARFWTLYENAFGPLRILAAARHVLSFDEFVDEMNDERIWKYVAHDSEGKMVGLTTLTDDLSSVPWISPDYFRHHYPEQTSRNAVFYLGFTLVEPTTRHVPVFFAMLRPIVLRVAARRAVCAYDISSYNDSVLSFGAGIERLLHRMAEVEVEPVDVQTYYAVRFSGALKRLGAGR